MNIKLTVSKHHGDYIKIDFEIINGICTFSGFDLMTILQVKNLEIELSSITKQLSDYRISLSGE